MEKSKVLKKWCTNMTRTIFGSPFFYFAFKISQSFRRFYLISRDVKMTTSSNCWHILI